MQLKVTTHIIWYSVFIVYCRATEEETIYTQNLKKIYNNSTSMYTKHLCRSVRCLLMLIYMRIKRFSYLFFIALFDNKYNVHFCFRNEVCIIMLQGMFGKGRWGSVAISSSYFVNSTNNRKLYVTLHRYLSSVTIQLNSNLIL